MASDFFFYGSNQLSLKGGFSPPPTSQVIYIRHLKTNRNCFIILVISLSKQASRRNPTTTWTRFTATSSTPALALQPDGTCVSLEEWQREMLGANCWFYHSNTEFVTPLSRSQGKQLYCGSIFHSMAVLGIKVGFYDGKIVFAILFVT